MIPKNMVDKENENKNANKDKTYRLDFEQNRVMGYTDGLDAVRQSVFKILSTERFAHLIYSGTYGTNLKEFVKTDGLGRKNRIENEVTQALLRDERIFEVNDIKTQEITDGVVMSLEVVCRYGNILIEKEVI